MIWMVGIQPAFSQSVLLWFLMFIVFPTSTSVQQDPLIANNIANSYLFTNSSNLTLAQGSYIIRVLVVGGGGAGCSSDQVGWGEAGEVSVSVISIAVNKKVYREEVVVGRGGELVNKPAGSASPPQPDNTGSSVFTQRAEGGRCVTTRTHAKVQHFEEFFFSTITYGPSGNESNADETSSIPGGEGGILINSTGPTAQDGKHWYSSGGGVGYGAGGGSAGKISAANITHPIAVDGGRGAPGVVYIEVVPIVCRDPVRVMFALDSSVRVRFINQQRVVDKLLGHFFHVSKTSTKASLMSYRNQTAIEIKFNQKNIENFDDLGLPIRMMKGVKDSNTTKPNFNNVLKTALQEFKESEKHSENSKYDIKTLVIFTHGATIIPNNEMTRLKKEFAKLMVKILVIGLAENLQREHLAKLASNRGYVIIADSSFTLINDTYRQVKIANLICRAPSYRQAIAMSTITPPTARPNTKDETLQKDFDYLINYDVSRSDPYNVTAVESILAIAGNLIRNGHKLPNASRISPGLKVLNFLENYGLSLADKLMMTDTESNLYKSYQHEDIDMTVVSVKMSTLDKLEFPQPLHSGQNGHVSLPREAFGKTDRGSVVVLLTNPVLSMKYTNISIVSRKMLSVKVKPKAKDPFEKPVSLAFAVNEIQKEHHQPSCAFWDLSIRSSLSPHGAWSTEGCQLRQANKTRVTCECSHLTSFAVLTKIFPREDSLGKHEKYLSIITYVGCSLSMLGCILTILIHACLPSLRTERTFIHLNLVSAILVAQCLFFIAASIKGPKGLCFAVAVGLYLFYLCVFAWMLVEGLHIYCLVIRVFHSGHERKRLYAVIGWALPVFITIVCAASFREDFVAQNICWLSTSSGAIWAFVGPALVIIAINLVILVLVLRVTATVMIKDEIQNNSNKSLVRACITLLPILGLTWLFGILAINNKTVVFEYLFCIFNSVQGLLIFFFYCIGSSEVRREVKRKLHNYETKRSLRSSSTGFKSPKQNNSILGKASSRSAELISQKDNNEDTRL